MEECHELQLAKYDCLGLKNIEIIKDCCELAGIPYPKSHLVNWEDKDVWDHIIDSPVGIFQFEGDYAFDLLRRYKPRMITHLSTINASLRPSGQSYRDKLIAHEKCINPSPMIDELLKDNDGWLIFQEDTIKFLTDICGLDGAEADNVRRAIGRKQLDRLQAALPKILEGLGIKLDGDGKFTLNPLRKVEKDALGGGLLKKPNDALAKMGKGILKSPFTGVATIGKKGIAGAYSAANGRGFRRGWSSVDSPFRRALNKKIDELKKVDALLWDIIDGFHAYLSLKNMGFFE